RCTRSSTITWLGSERSPTLHCSKVTFSRLSNPTKQTSLGSGTCCTPHPASVVELKNAHDANAIGPELKNRMGTDRSELEKLHPPTPTAALDARCVSSAGEICVRSNVHPTNVSAGMSAPYAISMNPSPSVDSHESPSTIADESGALT